jgi:predicted PurR-regulated permease PerM
MLMVLTPIVAYFFMMEWPNLRAWVYDLIPRYSSGTVADLITQINTKISGFVRGQLMVCSVLGLFYAIALAIAGLNFGFLIGITAGILSIIPLVGSTIGLVISVGVAFFQTGGWMFPAIVAGIFFFGQFVEGNFLSPKLLGESVGMHPLWVIFAVMGGSALFGVVGMFLAVPVAASIGVILNFAVRKYKTSEYYLGPGGAQQS